jgi:D-sedoheptulose 7-phosphate isomerase
MLFGMGISADAQHVAAELVGDLRASAQHGRVAFDNRHLHLDGHRNDLRLREHFRALVQALGDLEILVVGISTPALAHVLRALQWARDHNIFTIGFTGRDGGLMPPVCDICFIAPAEETARIQELHMAVWHAICDLVERSLTVD